MVPKTMGRSALDLMGAAPKIGEFYNYFTTGRFMKTDDYVAHMLNKKAPRRVRKAGRPRAIPDVLEPVVVVL